MEQETQTNQQTNKQTNDYSDERKIQILSKWKITNKTFAMCCDPFDTKHTNPDRHSPRKSLLGRQLCLESTQEPDSRRSLACQQQWSTFKATTWSLQFVFRCLAKSSDRTIVFGSTCFSVTDVSSSQIILLPLSCNYTLQPEVTVL